jgi:hypothetical protein
LHPAECNSAIRQIANLRYAGNHVTTENLQLSTCNLATQGLLV